MSCREELVLVNRGSKLDFSSNENDCFIMEKSTKLQSEFKNWFMYRSGGRITASRAKDICALFSLSAKTTSPGINLFKKLQFSVLCL